MANSYTAAVERFRAAQPDLERVAKELDLWLVVVLRASNLDGYVSTRPKTVRSFGQKILRKQYADPWTEVTDKVGGRVVVSLPGSVGAVAERVAAGLTDPDIEDKRDIQDPDKLEYSGVHITGILPNAQVDGEPAVVEVQVRTAVQDAWSVVSHSFVYKPVVTLPRQPSAASCG